MAVRTIFTGIVEEIGVVRDIRPGVNSTRLGVLAQTVLEDVKLGDSIAVNGVCLTVVEYEPRHFWADVMPETYANTTLKGLRPGDPVNLERALRLSDRLGGHLVQGHVDGMGTIIERKPFDISVLYRIKAPQEVLRYTVPKGSIAVDGISLTVVDVENDCFSVALIPHTLDVTILGSKQTGATVNLESDIIGRYVEKLLQPDLDKSTKRNNLGIGFLSEHGFL